VLPSQINRLAMYSPNLIPDEALAAPAIAAPAPNAPPAK
jgi:hypothetical protein